MTSRVTQGMMNAQLMRNLSNSMKQMNTLLNQNASGKRINSPSDDPVGITFAMRYRSELAANDQYQRNTDAAISNLDYVDMVLNQTGQVLHRVRELTVSAANGTNPQAGLDAVKIEIEEMFEQLVDIGNSQFKGKYVFNGQLTDHPPYTSANAANESTDSHNILFELGAGLTIPVNVTGNEVFGSAGEEDNVFQIMTDLVNHLDHGDHEAIDSMLSLIDSRMDKVLDARSTVGARTNRIELVESRLQDVNINLQSLQAKVEDADMAEVIINLKMAENVYQAALAAGSRLISPSLVDFLR